MAGTPAQQAALNNATLSELVPIGDLSLPERRQIRDDVDISLVATALDKKLANNAGGLVVRDVLPTTDMGLTGGASATGQQWIIAGAGTAGAELAYINAQQLTTTQCAAFWGVAHAIAPSQVGRIRFAYGATQAQIKMVVQLEQLLCHFEPEGYLSTPVLYVAQDYITVYVTPMYAWAANSERLVLLARIVDLFGSIVSAINFA